MNEPVRNQYTLLRARVAGIILLLLATVFPGLAANYAGWAVGHPAEGSGSIHHPRSADYAWAHENQFLISNSDPELRVAKGTLLQ